MSNGSEHLNDNVLGIDFGTCFSSAALLKGGVPEPVREPFGSGFAMPSSVVLTSEGNLAVGQVAENAKYLTPDHYRREFKRDLARREPIPLGDREFFAEELVTAILRTLRLEAEESVHAPVSSATITVPATYASARRSEMASAALAAGFSHVELLDEPVAAAIYGNVRHPLQNDSAMTLVYDLGGGTFDATLVRQSGDSYEVVGAPVGLSHCGGIDFDRLIYSDILNQVSDSYRDLLDHQRSDTLGRQARRQAEDFATRVKYQLSHLQQYEDQLTLTIPFEHYQLSRARFNEMITPLLDETIDQCHHLLTDSGISPSDLDRILLVGGSARIPLVRELLEREFSVVPVRADDPEMAVCKGAAIHGGQVENPAQSGTNVYQAAAQYESSAETTPPASDYSQTVAPASRSGTGRDSTVALGATLALVTIVGVVCVCVLLAFGL